MSLEGRLEDLRLADIFQIISLSKRSGVGFAFGKALLERKLQETKLSKT